MYSEKRFLRSLYFGSILAWGLFSLFFVFFFHSTLLVIPVFIFGGAIGGLIGISILKRVLPLFFDRTFTKPEEKRFDQNKRIK